MPGRSAECGHLEAILYPERHLHLRSAPRRELSPERSSKHSIHGGEVGYVCEVHRASHDVSEGEIAPSEYVNDDLNAAIRLAGDIAPGEVTRRVACDLTRDKYEVARYDSV